MQNLAKKNAPAPINTLSYAVSIILSGASGDELALFKNVSQSVRQSGSQQNFLEQLQFSLTSADSLEF